MASKATDTLRESTLAVVGPGAIGTTLAVRLASSGQGVAVLDHRPARVEAIRRNGLPLRAAEGEWTGALQATTDPADLAAVEIVLICVKCPALESVGRALRQLPKSATLVPMQNGLGVLEALGRGLADDADQHTIVRAVTYLAARPDADGTIRQVANLPTRLDGCPARHEAATDVAERLLAANLPAEVEADLEPAVWRKLVVNAAINPVTALERVPNGAVLERPDLRAQMLALAYEAAAVARAAGVAIGDTEAEALATEAARNTAENLSSMLQDVMAGRPTEIDFLGGALLRAAEHYGLDLRETRRATDAIGNL
jgi:2-dehydropantoate 2-reductase